MPKVKNGRGFRPATADSGSRGRGTNLCRPLLANCLAPEYITRWNVATLIGDVAMTTTEAANYLGFAEGTVRRYIQRGLINAKRFGPIYLVTKTECDRYMRERRPRGNPHLKKGA